MNLEVVSYFKRFLEDYPLVYLNLPSGSGRTYVLSSLYSDLRENSLFTRYSSHRTPAGEFLLTMLRLVDRKSFFREKGSIVGPILRRYIHPSFLKYLRPYKTQDVIDIDTEVIQILDVAELILKGKKINYWFIDDWQEYEDYNELFGPLLPRFIERFGIHFFITGRDLPQFPYFEISKDSGSIPFIEKDFVLEEIERSFGLTYREADEVYTLAKGNWNDIILILRNGYRPVDAIVRENLERLTLPEKKALYSMSAIGKTFSTRTIKAIRDLYTISPFFKDFIDRGIIRWEYPLWRFASDSVLEVIREGISESENRKIHTSLIDKLSAYNYSDLWGRIAILAGRIGDEARWLYAKLREYRNTNLVDKRLKSLREIIDRGYRKDLYLRRMSKILVDTHRYSEALNILENIREKRLLDLALEVRCLSYLGRYEEAKVVLDKILEDLKLDYDTPEVLSQLASYYFLQGRSKDGLELLNSYIKEMIDISSSPRFLSDFYNSLAILNSISGNINDALHFFTLALDYAKKSNNNLSLYRVTNNLGDVERYVYGPKTSIRYALDAYRLSKMLSKNFMVVSLANLINTKIQFCHLTEIEPLLGELERLLEYIDVEYFSYIGYRRLSLVSIYHHKIEDLRRYLTHLRIIESIPESKVLVKILEGYLGEETDLLSLEKDVLDTNEIQTIILYLRLLLERGLTSKRIIREFSLEFPLYNFLRALMEGEDLPNLLAHVDNMLERWEFLDALNAYLLLTKRDELQEWHLFLLVEAMSISLLLGLSSITSYLRERIYSEGFNTYRYIEIKSNENYYKDAIINSEDEFQAISFICSVISRYLSDFFIRIKIGLRYIDGGNSLLGEDDKRLHYERSSFSITLYSREEPERFILFLLRSLLNAFVFFWSRRYGIYDPLTGLFNRAYGVSEIEKLYNRYKRTGEPFSVIFIDIDSLKRINDTMGHSYGDYVLQQVASSIRGVIRQYDSVIRWGGDEFLVLLGNTDYTSALEIAKRINDKINSSSRGSFSVSYGVETISEDIDSYDRLIEIADIKMYTNKHSKGKL